MLHSFAISRVPGLSEPPALTSASACWCSVFLLLPAALQAVGGVVPALLSDGHAAITHTLAQLSRADPASSAFDLAVLEVVEVLEHHAKVCLVGLPCSLQLMCGLCRCC